jgi:hypothetical protein
VELAGDNDSLQTYYDANASRYDTWMRSYDRFMLGDARQRLCALANGRTLELAVGTGLNLALRPFPWVSSGRVGVGSGRLGRAGRGR